MISPKIRNSILQFAICILHFRICIFQFAFLSLRFISCLCLNKKESRRNGSFPTDQPFFLISEITSSIKDNAFSPLFSSTNVSFAFPFLPPLMWLAVPALLFYTKYSIGERNMLHIYATTLLPHSCMHSAYHSIYAQ